MKQLTGRSSRWWSTILIILTLASFGLIAPSRVWLNLGYVALSQDHPQSAEFRFTQATQIDHYSASAWRGIGMALDRQSKADQALEYYDTALTLRPDDPLVHLMRANDRKLSGDLNGALEDLRAIGSFQLLIQLGQRAMTNGENEWAIALYRLATEVAPDDWTAYYYLAAGLRNITPARLEEAQRTLELGLTLSPDTPELLLMSGQNEYALKDYYQATATFSRYIDLKPTDFAGWYWRGLCFQALQLLPQAAPDFRKAIVLYPTDSNSHLHLAQVLEQLGNRHAALSEFQNVLNLIPNQTEAQQAVERLKDAR